MIKLKELRAINKMSQQKLASMLGVSRSTVAMWEISSSQPDNDHLLKMANIFNTSVDALLGRDPIPVSGPPASTGGVWVPVLGTVAAGTPIEAIQDVLDYEEIPTDMAAQGEYFGLVIKGQSMEPKISDGDVVIVRRQTDVENGQIAVVLVNGDEATVKRIKKRPEGLLLIPSNPTYEPMFYSNEEIEKLPVTIIGRVVELRAKF